MLRPRNKDSGPKLTNFRACEDLHGRWKLTKQPGWMFSEGFHLGSQNIPTYVCLRLQLAVNKQLTSENKITARFKFPLETSSTRDQVWPSRSSCCYFMPGSSWTTSPRKYKVIIPIVVRLQNGSLTVHLYLLAWYLLQVSCQFKICTLWFRASPPHLSPLAGTMLLGETRNTTWPLGSHTPGEIQPIPRWSCYDGPKGLSEIRLDVEKNHAKMLKGPKHKGTMGTRRTHSP